MINGVLTVVLVFLALMLGGLVGAWAIWPTAERHGYAEGESDRHRHRLGDPQETTLLALPRAGRIPLERLADPTPFPGEVELARALWPSESPNAHWRFKGEQDPGWAAEAAEYERPPQPEPELSDTGEIRAIGDAMVAKMVGDTNEYIFGMRVF